MKNSLLPALFMVFLLGSADIIVDANWDTLGGGKAWPGMTSFFKVTIKNTNRDETPQVNLVITVEDESLHLSGPLAWQELLQNRAEYTVPFHHGAEVNIKKKTEPVELVYNEDEVYYFGIEADEQAKTQNYKVKIAAQVKNPDGIVAIPEYKTAQKELRLQVEETIRMTFPSIDLIVGGEMKSVKIRLNNQGKVLEKLTSVSTTFEVVTPECEGKILFCDFNDRQCKDSEWVYKPKRKSIDGSIEQDANIEYRMRVDDRFYCDDEEICGQCHVRMNVTFTTDKTDLLLKRSYSSLITDDNMRAINIRAGDKPKTSIKISGFSDVKGEFYYNGRIDEVVEIPILIKNIGKVYGHHCRAVWDIKRLGDQAAGDLFEFQSPAKATADGSDLKSDAVIIEELKPGEEKDIKYKIKVLYEKAEPGPWPVLMDVFCKDAFAKDAKAQKEGDWSRFYINVTFPPLPEVELIADSIVTEVSVGESVSVDLIASNSGEYPATNCTISVTWSGEGTVTGERSVKLSKPLLKNKDYSKSLEFKASIPGSAKDEWNTADDDPKKDPRVNRQSVSATGNFKLLCKDKFGKSEIRGSSSLSIKIREPEDEFNKRKTATEEAAKMKMMLIAGVVVVAIIIIVVVMLQRQKKQRLRDAGGGGAPGAAAGAAAAAGGAGAAAMQQQYGSYYGNRYGGNQYYGQQAYQQYGYQQQ